MEKIKGRTKSEKQAGAMEKWYDTCRKPGRGDACLHMRLPLSVSAGNEDLHMMTTILHACILEPPHLNFSVPIQSFFPLTSFCLL